MIRSLKITVAVICISCLLIIILISIMSFFSITEYSTRGAVTYFDDKGQYQLINSVDEDYVIYDAKEERFISGFILYYIQKENKIYMVTNPNRKEIAYAILNTKEEVYTSYKNIEDFEENEQKILLNTEDMIDLTKKRSRALKNILKFVPQRWRKW